jgi:SAM-dependent methyltransferase
LKNFIESNRSNIDQTAKRYQTLPNMSEFDHIFRFIVTNPVFSSSELSINYYFMDGKNSAELLTNIINEYLTKDRVKLLEFASGYGCVTRHLTDRPKLDVFSCDIHEQAIKFIEKELGGKGILSHSDPAKLDIAAGSFDVVFCLSFFSHVPDRNWFKWLESLYNVVTDGGILIFTTHGYQSMKFFNGFNPVLDEKGYWFLPDSEQLDLDVQDYGQTIVSPAYVAGKIKQLPGNPVIVKASEGYWWGHQDLWIVRK